MTPTSSPWPLRRLALPAGGLLFLVCSCSTDMRTKPVREAKFMGTIRDPVGNGLAGYQVNLGYVDQAVTDSSGQFLLEDPEGTYDIVIMPRSDFGPAPWVKVHSVRVRAPVTRWDYSYVGFAVQGTVTGPTGAPVDTGIIDAFRPFSGEIFSNEVRARVLGGRYRMFLTRGAYNVSVSSQLTVPQGIPSFSVQAVSISADTTIDFALTGQAVSGVATLGPGAPVQGASVKGLGRESSTAVTRADGSYELYLPAGDYDWVVFPGPQHLNVMPFRQAGPGVPGPTTLNFDLSGVRWSGTVRLSGSGQPVPSVVVKAERNYDTAWSTTDGAGHFDLILRPGARYALRLYSQSGAIAPAGFFGVLAGNDSTFDLLVSPRSP